MSVNASNAILKPDFPFSLCGIPGVLEGLNKAGCENVHLLPENMDDLGVNPTHSTERAICK